MEEPEAAVATIFASSHRPKIRTFMELEIENIKTSQYHIGHLVLGWVLGRAQKNMDSSVK